MSVTIEKMQARPLLHTEKFFKRRLTIVCAAEFGSEFKFQIESLHIWILKTSSFDSGRASLRFVIHKLWTIFNVWNGRGKL